MKYHRYEYSTEKDLYFFEFESIGIKGKIKKIVQYSEMSVKGFYNLGFGDYNEITKEIDDEITNGYISRLNNLSILFISSRLKILF